MNQQHPRLGISIACTLFVMFCCNVVTGDDAFKSIRSYVHTYCVKCHNSETTKGELDLTQFKSAHDVADGFRRWNNIIEFIRDGEMPPKDAKQPSIDESNAVVARVNGILLSRAIEHAGDPGVVLPRRLSNTEYDLSIRDLTGVDIRPTKDFPPDPAGGEGFDNTGETLRMSPNLVRKYLAAAQLVADHIVLTPNGISFAPHRVRSYNERKKLAEQAIIDFYEAHAVDTFEYLEAAWRYRYRSPRQQNLSIEQWAATRELSPKYLAIVWTTLKQSASHTGLLNELGRVWNSVPAPTSMTDRPAELQTVREFVAFGTRVLAPPRQQLIRPNAGNWPISHLDFRTKIATTRDQYDRSQLINETLINAGRIEATSANQDAQTRSVFLRIDPGFSDGENWVLVKRPIFSLATILPNNEADEKVHHKVQTLLSVLKKANPELVTMLEFGRHPSGRDIDPEWFVVKAPAVIEIPITVEMQRELNGKNLLLPCQLDQENSPDGSVFIQSSFDSAPTGKIGASVEHLIYSDSQTAKQMSESAAIFCNAFPNQFFYVDETRGLAAGFHLVEGFFRDDHPLVNKVLSDVASTKLDLLWQELEFITNSWETLLRGFVWFERSERHVLHDKRFDFLRPEDPQLVEADLLNRFEGLYLEKNGIKRVGDTLEAEMPDQKYLMIHGFFDEIRAGLKRQQDLMTNAEARGLLDLERLAEQAYRRSLSLADRERLRSLYEELKQEGQAIEESLRGVFTAVLMSPDFCFRYNTVPGGTSTYAVDDMDLASRLSFFLWSSLPDEKLLSAARDGTLQDGNVLIAQTRRMLKDTRINAFSREFFGQWLRYRDYLANDPIHVAAFPGYSDELRMAMFQEPERLITHLIQHDKPITSLLNSDETFVNRVLANHYGGEILKQYRTTAPNSEDEWCRVSGLHAQGRGGLYGMAVILTKNSAGERTSPVKRGFWISHHLLGQHFPPPPADVAELPSSEKDAPRTIRDLLAAHVADTKCAMCHKHFDSLGLAMESFDPIGRFRIMDGAGRAIEKVAEFPNGKRAEGIPGLIRYIEQERHQDFVRTLCRKFLGYALGRSVLLSDQPLLNEMEQLLAKNDDRFSVLFEAVILSPQFRNQRGRDFPSR